MNISADCSRAGLILFAKKAWIEFNLTEHLTPTSLGNAIEHAKPRHRKGTDTPEALRLLKTAGAINGRLGLRDGKIHIAVFITDGKTNLNHRNKADPEADRETELAGNELHESRFYDQIYAVGINESENTLSYIATPPSLTFSLAELNQNLINELTTNISKILCDGK